MTIEIHSPQGQVSQWVIDYVKEKLMEFYHRDREIARAQVYFRQIEDNPLGTDVCEIQLTIYGNSLFIHRTAGSFEMASREAIEELTSRIDDQIGKQKEPPDQATSTVKV